jgi:ubiquinone biosynthesis monooxygenase Coq7
MNNKYKYLPGDKPKNKDIESMIRVNHAGELGAKRIYAGQKYILRNTDLAEALEHMEQQEIEHFNYFDKEIQKRNIRPTALSPIWNIAGFALGAGTALLGKRAAMACTVAVEETIDKHYQEQIETLETLGKEEADLKSNIIKFREEELEHRDIGLENEAEQTPAYSLLYNMVAGGSKVAIWLSKRF